MLTANGNQLEQGSTIRAVILFRKKVLFGIKVLFCLLALACLGMFSRIGVHYSPHALVTYSPGVEKFTENFIENYFENHSVSTRDAFSETDQATVLNEEEVDEDDGQTSSACIENPSYVALLNLASCQRPVTDKTDNITQLTPIYLLTERFRL